MRMSKSVAVTDILAVARDADAILVTYAKLPGELLRQLRRCKVIGRFGLGVDNIDIKTAAELGIVVTYVPDYCMREVSDHAMALLLALARKIPFSNQLVQGGRWEMPAVAPLRRLAGQVLGLIGFGNIPRALAPKAKAFGFEVIAYDPYAGSGAFAACGVEAVSLETLLARSDAISVHAPLTPATRGLIDASAFARMKKGALIVNTARGPLIDEQLWSPRRSVILAERRSTWSRPNHWRRIPRCFTETTWFSRRTRRSIRSRHSTSCRPNAPATSRACSRARSRSIR